MAQIDAALTGVPPASEKALIQMAEELDEISGNRKLVIAVAAGGGERDFKYLAKHLRDRKLRFVKKSIVHDRWPKGPKNGQFKEIRGLEKINVTGIGNLVMFDNSINEGYVCFGMIKRGLEARKGIGYDELYIATIADKLGASNIAALPEYKKENYAYLGPEKALLLGARDIHTELRQKLLLRYLSNYVGKVHEMPWYEFIINPRMAYQSKIELKMGDINFKEPIKNALGEVYGITS